MKNARDTELVGSPSVNAHIYAVTPMCAKLSDAANSRLAGRITRFMGDMRIGPSDAERAHHVHRAISLRTRLSRTAYSDDGMDRLLPQRRRLRDRV